jgi:hypothetical protein
MHKFHIYFDGSFDFYVPVPYWNISAFRHTLGHKINHSFKYNNTKFGYAYHPRFGNVRTIVASKNITKGEELLISFGYELGSHVPQWYSELYQKNTGIDWYSHTQKSQQNQRQQHPSSKHVKKHQQHKQCT